MAKREETTTGMLRAMPDGSTIVIDCDDQYDLNSKKSIAYMTAKLEGCKFSCKADGLKLEVTRNNM